MLIKLYLLHHFQNTLLWWFNWNHCWKGSELKSMYPAGFASRDAKAHPQSCCIIEYYPWPTPLYHSCPVAWNGYVHLWLTQHLWWSSEAGCPSGLNHLNTVGKDNSGEEVWDETGGERNKHASSAVTQSTPAWLNCASDFPLHHRQRCAVPPLTAWDTHCFCYIKSTVQSLQQPVAVSVPVLTQRK